MKDKIKIIVFTTIIVIFVLGVIGHCVDDSGSDASFVSGKGAVGKLRSDKVNDEDAANILNALEGEFKRLNFIYKDNYKIKVTNDEVELFNKYKLRGICFGYNYGFVRAAQTLHYFQKYCWDNNISGKVNIYIFPLYESNEYDPDDFIILVPYDENPDIQTTIDALFEKNEICHYYHDKSKKELNVCFLNLGSKRSNWVVP